MKIDSAVIIVGGGLAGLTAAIHLSKLGFSVVVIEKNDFPKHKVCGEYISNEVLGYYKWLDISLSDLNPTAIKNLEFSTSTGRLITCKLPLGGFGLSRYALDELLYKKTIANGTIVIKDTVTDIIFKNEQFTVSTENSGYFKSKIVLGAFGKRSSMDQRMDRSFFKKKSSWLAVKGHYYGDFTDDVVGLHNFEGGYCGVSKVENDQINICYLCDYDSFKKYKNIADYQVDILYKNPFLKSIFESSTAIFDKPLTIGQISFRKKKTIENHVLMIGDSAGLIHPLCGNGMAMAIHSAKIASDLVCQYQNGTIKTRGELEKIYKIEWNTNFRSRLQAGRFLSAILRKQKLSSFILRTLVLFPFLLPIIIKKTHGKLII
ncbi:NAD(P)/FAD-dependent oxidoreductase [Flavobacterium muglaense]|uniref:NAD(P)/FAD-dependent oxidoreductase n=1 Tax=Flavobacterium muglaense TaxID=2764716 RepID=A0A923SG09_9FLAO|nr:NAD(P)/FAD-dependent oxidoreductase [Flavobacterium muglaense]MBC5838736.1 NAD(P)/FAD-dependent oxidoreductase [Flavobacterium muglaense]MBC5845232.1 NAD(P)/FAD-dependent oxidoreductase [Flavobacterium muglaense]